MSQVGFFFESYLRAEHDAFATSSIDSWWQWWHGGVGRSLRQQLLAAMPLVTWQLSCAELAFNMNKASFSILGHVQWAMSNVMWNIHNKMHIDVNMWKKLFEVQIE